MSTFSLVLFIILSVLFSYFGVANAVIHLINYFKFYKPFNKRLLEYDVYTDPAFANTVKGRLTGTLIVFVITLGATVFCCVRLMVPSHGVVIPAVIVGFAFGIFLYSKKLRYELWNVQQFVKQYREYLDKEKFSRFLRREYDISLEKLSDDHFVTQRLARKGK